MTREQAISALRSSAIDALCPLFAICGLMGSGPIVDEAEKAIAALRKAEFDLHEATMAEIQEPQS